LRHVRNNKTGLKTRTKLLNTLGQTSNQALSLASATSLSYSVVSYHLRLLKNEGIMTRTGKRPYNWLLTGKGQKQLIS